MCQCGFSKSDVDKISFAACNNQFSEYVSFQARLSGTSDNDSEYLIFLLEKWISTSPIIFVSGLQMKVTNNELNCITFVHGHDDMDCVGGLKRTQKDYTVIIGIVLPTLAIVIPSIVAIAVAIKTGKGTHKKRQ